MLIRARIIRSAIALLAVTIVGTGGYVVIEGWTALEGVYMTFVTVTTVGYDEVHPLSDGGRVFTIFLMVGGIGVMLYILTATVQSVIEGGVLIDFVRRRRMQARLESTSDHYVVCGFGRVGKAVAKALQSEEVEVVVVDNQLEVIEDAERLGLAYVQGDATDDETLRQAGIERAHGLIVATSQDSGNVFITLSARGLVPGLVIVARSTDPGATDKLIRAGADRVISPHEIGGRRMALSAIRPRAVDFFETIVGGSGADVRLAEGRGGGQLAFGRGHGQRDRRRAGRAGARGRSKVGRAAAQPQSSYESRAWRSADARWTRLQTRLA